jgi:hypothetical protein
VESAFACSAAFWDERLVRNPSIAETFPGLVSTNNDGITTIKKVEEAFGRVVLEFGAGLPVV